MRWGPPKRGVLEGTFWRPCYRYVRIQFFFVPGLFFFSRKFFIPKKIVGSLGFLRSVQVSVTKSAVSDQTAQWATTPARDKSEIGQTGPQPQNHGSSQNLVARNAAVNDHGPIEPAKVRPWHPYADHYHFLGTHRIPAIPQSESAELLPISTERQ